MAKRPLRRTLVWLTIVSASAAYNSSGVPLNHDACLTSNQCLNGGVCTTVDSDQGSFRHCHCPSGFGGFRCENYCPLRCQNSGVCQHKGDSSRIESYIHDTNKDHYVCKCKGYFTGKLCQTSYVNCGGHQCLNGGVCQGQTCGCPDGYDGEYCQTIKTIGLTRIDTKQEKVQTATIVLSSVLFAMVLLLVGIVLKRNFRSRRRRQYNEEHETLRINTIPREEREEWECRNII